MVFWWYGQVPSPVRAFLGQRQALYFLHQRLSSSSRSLAGIIVASSARARPCPRLPGVRRREGGFVGFSFLWASSEISLMMRFLWDRVSLREGSEDSLPFFFVVDWTRTRELLLYPSTLRFFTAIKLWTGSWRVMPNAAGWYGGLLCFLASGEIFAPRGNS